MMGKFKVGEVVELNSGGPAMTILEVKDNGRVVCEWFDKNHIRHEKDFIDSNVVIYEILMPFSI